MSTDIWLYVEVDTDCHWQYAREIELDQDYNLFRRMGCDWRGDSGILPIVPVRGRPVDLDPATLDAMDGVYHWLTSQEVLQLCGEYPYLQEHIKPELRRLSKDIQDWRWLFHFD